MSANAVLNKKPTRNGCASSKSSESLFSASSINSKTRILHRRSHSGFISLASPHTSDVRQRVLSARQHRFRALQNKLNEVLQENASLVNENRLLKTLHKRQDTALAKYEQASAELPQLLDSHSQELHVWQTKYRALNVQHRELNKRIVQKDKTINELSDRMKHLKHLTEIKNLEERDTLTSKVRSLERQLDDKDDEIRTLTRRNYLEAKNFKAQLVNVNRKYKELCQKTESIQTKRFPLSNDTYQSSAKSYTREAKQSHALVVHVNNSTPTKSIDSDPNEYSEHGRSIAFVKNAGSDEPSQEDSQHEDDSNLYDDDDDDLIIKSMIDQDRKNSRIENRQFTDFFKNLTLNGATDALPNIQDIREEINDDIEANEVLLDLHCGEISKHLGQSNDSADVDEVIGVSHIESHIPRPMLPAALKRNSKPRLPIDPRKKSDLLAALKSIDSTK